MRRIRETDAAACSAMLTYKKLFRFLEARIFESVVWTVRTRTAACSALLARLHAAVQAVDAVMQHLRRGQRGVALGQKILGE